ncbi:Cof-type HAD-IIB family hydrolase [Exiguobacterium sp. s48]|uniref:Cof-type HAD-IIB family hydrolase n=1 Tax=Exiguobacterium sp. s48 TaxID=2751273 RepID=UPI001BE9C467|nr:Cof-type HAD-IIB family hydrolase [Exiguobacterium sp. s48]
MIQAILLDLDGTLLNDDKMITEQTKRTLLALQAQGVKVVLASGRPKRGMIRYAEELKLNEFDGLIVSSNGACVTDASTGDTLFEQAMQIDDVRSILEHLENYEVIPMINDDTYMYVRDVFEGQLDVNGKLINIIEYESRGGQFQLREEPSLIDIIDFPVHKILVAGEPSYLRENAPALAAPFTGRVTSMFTAAMYYEFTDLGIDKAKALRHVFKELGIDRDQVIAFGDGHNDRSIIEYAGIGIAMGNAVDALIDIATEVTTSNNDDGISKILERYITH